MKKQNRFKEAEEFIRSLTWLIFLLLGFLGFIMIAVKQFLDGFKSLW
jgi:hypothetical protein